MSIEERAAARLAAPVTLLIQPDPWLWSKENRAVMVSWVSHSAMIARQVHRGETGPRSNQKVQSMGQDEDQ